jgi:hypothetical protein
LPTTVYTAAVILIPQLINIPIHQLLFSYCSYYSRIAATTVFTHCSCCFRTVAEIPIYCSIILVLYSSYYFQTATAIPIMQLKILSVTTVPLLFSPHVMFRPLYPYCCCRRDSVTTCLLSCTSIAFNM